VRRGALCSDVHLIDVLLSLSSHCAYRDCRRAAEHYVKSTSDAGKMSGKERLDPILSSCNIAVAVMSARRLLSPWDCEVWRRTPRAYRESPCAVFHHWIESSLPVSDRLGPAVSETLRRAAESLHPNKKTRTRKKQLETT